MVPRGCGKPPKWHRGPAKVHMAAPKDAPNRSMLWGLGHGSRGPCGANLLPCIPVPYPLESGLKACARCPWHGCAWVVLESMCPLPPQPCAQPTGNGHSTEHSPAGGPKHRIQPGQKPKHSGAKTQGTLLKAQNTKHDTSLWSTRGANLGATGGLSFLP